MKSEDKIQQILNAYNAGMPKKKIDLVGNGSSLKTLLKGGKPSQRKIDEMYSNVLIYKEQETKTNQLNLSLAPADSLTRHQKEQIIIQAVKAGIPKYKLNPTSQGTSINRLLEGKTLWPKTVDEIYQNLLNYLGYSDGSCPTDQQKFYEQKIKSLETVIISLVGQVESLQTQVQQLQVQCKSLSHLPQPEAKSTRKICGLTIIQKSSRVKGRSYKRWYAIYKSAPDAKRRLIYIGNDLAKAQEKIQAGIARLGAKS